MEVTMRCAKCDDLVSEEPAELCSICGRAVLCIECWDADLICREHTEPVRLSEAYAQLKLAPPPRVS
jgi:hypothetical protein